MAVASIIYDDREPAHSTLVKASGRMTNKLKSNAKRMSNIFGSDNDSIEK